MAVPARAHSLFPIFPPKAVEPTWRADALSEQRPHPPTASPAHPSPQPPPCASLQSPYVHRMGLPCSSGLSSAPCSWGSGTTPKPGPGTGAPWDGGHLVGKDIRAASAGRTFPPGCQLILRVLPVNRGWGVCRDLPVGHTPGVPLLLGHRGRWAHKELRRRGELGGSPWSPPAPLCLEGQGQGRVLRGRRARAQGRRGLHCAGDCLESSRPWIFSSEALSGSSTSTV